MTFFDTKPEGSEFRKFDRTEFLSLTPGQHFVRIVGVPKMHRTHYLARASTTFKCLGDDCPVCKNNKQIILEYPEKFREQKGWNPSLRRHYINVIDQTPVKVCPNCGKESKRGMNNLFSPACECGTFITGVVETVSGKLKVLNVSETNAELINAYDSSILTPNGEKLGVNNFDIVFIVTGAGQQKKITPSPLPSNNAKVEYDETKLYNLDRVVIEVTADEIVELLRGISLRDIFAARNKQEFTPVAEDVEKLAKSATEISADLKKKIDELF
jgi:hypothetical protein